MVMLRQQQKEWRTLILTNSNLGAMFVLTMKTTFVAT